MRFDDGNIHPYFERCVDISFVPVGTAVRCLAIDPAPYSQLKEACESCEAAPVWQAIREAIPVDFRTHYWGTLLPRLRKPLQ